MLLQAMLFNASVDVENSENRLLFVLFSQTAVYKFICREVEGVAFDSYL